MNDTAYNNEITNRMLYDLIVGQGQEITGLKQDIAGLKQEMTGMKQEIAGLKQDIVRLDAKVGRLDEKIDRLELKVEKNSERIEELFLKGDRVQIGFSRAFLAGNSILAAAVAFIVAMFTGQYVMRVK